MAIEKVEGKKFEWTPAVAIQLGGAAVLVILSLVFGWFAFARWRFKEHLVAGYRAHDSRQISQAKPRLADAIAWRPDHPGPLQVLAKIEAEAGNTAAAERYYQQLRALVPPYDPPQVRAGMGVVNLKKALAATDPKEVNRLVGAAMQEFRSAAGIPESDIGLGHCELVLAYKLGETTRTATARAHFEKVKAGLAAKEEYRRQITREGLLDFYCGLGKAVGSGPKYDPSGRAAFKACSQYEPRWRVPQKSMVAVEAIRFARWTDPTAQDLLGAKADAMAQLLEFNNRWKPNAQAWNELKEQWMSFALSASQAYARAGLEKEFVEFLEQVTRAGGFTDRVEPYQVEAVGRSILALRENPNANERSKLVGIAYSRCEALLPRLKADNDPKGEWKARTLNMMALLDAWRAAQNQPAVYQRGMDRLNEALKIAPDEYVYLRNAALILKRQKKPATAIQPFLDKAKAAAKGDYEKDFEELQKVIAGN
jgi:hypothetical protein